MLGEEGVFGANDLAFEVSREGRMVFGQAYLTQILSALL